MDGSSGLRYADHRTPLIRDAWYIGALGREVGEALTDRWMLEQSLLFYRKRDGVVTALQNRCPHRSYPLSQGTRAGDAVICGYHGITFGADGRCLRIPSQPGPTDLRTRVYPTVERGPFVWVWMGEADAADPQRISDIPWLDDPAFANVAGVIEAPCNYIRLHENVLDLSHLPFLHKESLPQSALDRARPKVSGDGVRVRAEITLEVEAQEGPQAPPRPLQRKLDLRFETPALHIATGAHETPAPDGSVRVKTTGYVHAFTPIDAVSTRYFWCVSRDDKLDDPAVDEEVAAQFSKVFAEDVVGLGLVEELWSRERRDGFQEVSIVSDRAGLRMRENIQRLADHEAKTRIVGLAARVG